jgi:DNA-binding transcriptional ArsR family regulator
VTDGSEAEPDGRDAALQAVLDALADPDCRRILAALDEPRTASAVAERCDLPRTSAYRKLSLLSDADLVAERVAVREDGTHPTAYRRDLAAATVRYDDRADAFVLEVAEAGEDPDRDPAAAAGDDDGEETTDERLARLWSRVGEEFHQ